MVRAVFLDVNEPAVKRCCQKWAWLTSKVAAEPGRSGKYELVMDIPGESRFQVLLECCSTLVQLFHWNIKLTQHKHFGHQHKHGEQISKQAWEAKGGRGKLTSDEYSLGTEAKLPVDRSVPLNGVYSLCRTARQLLFPAAVNVEDAVGVRIELVSDCGRVLDLRLHLLRLHEDLLAFSFRTHLKREHAWVQLPLKRGQF